MYLQEPTVIIKMQNGDKRLSIEDGYNRLRGTIAEWGEKLGLPKGKVDFQNTDDTSLMEYCKRDVEILARATIEYLRFVQKHNLGKVKYTISGQAFNAYRHRFMRQKIYVHDNEKVLRLEREAYGGGMVRVFRRGHFEGDKYYLLDVNSMYGYVMRAFTYPKRLVGYKEDVSVTDLERYIRTFGVIAHCVVHPRTPAFRCRWLGKITYPTCLFEGAFTTEEIKRLLAEDAILSVREAAFYTMGDLFTEYVDYFWDLRHTAIVNRDSITKTLSKQFLNSLYGKFGARGVKWVLCDWLIGAPVIPDAHYDEKLGRYCTIVMIGGMPYIEQIEEEAAYSVPAIAAHITANARMTLWSYVELAGIENTYYTDTDSLIVNSTGYKRLLPHVNSEELGRLKLEKESDTLTIWARKDYQIGDKVVCKGVGKAYLVPGAVEYKREQWQSLRVYLQAQGIPEVIVRTKELALQRICYDGEITADGRVIPFTELPDKWG
jgi:hypothetical protein